MKVKELIKELLEYNMDAEVVTSCSETVELSYIEEGGSETFTMKDTPYVFIDGVDLDGYRSDES